MAAIGVAALPMIAIMAASTGMILALQGAAELRRFGALRYVIDLVAVGFTRELGPAIDGHRREWAIRVGVLR